MKLDQQKLLWLLWILFFLLIAIPIFLHLDKLPVRIWDEAHMAMNAYEMLHNGNFIVTHFNGEPDLWCTKPPLLIWLQVLFIKLIGFNELAIRLPSALAAVGTCLLLIWFSREVFGQVIMGMLACLVLVTTNGYIHIHASRTGDYDALLTFFTTLFIFSFYLYYQKDKLIYLHLFFVGIGLAILTKSVQGMIFLPAILVFLLVKKKMLSILQRKWLYIDTAFLLLVVGGYFVLREAYNPGYLRAVWENELLGRYLSTLEENAKPPWYYLRQLFGFLLGYWTFTLPLALMIIYRVSKNQPRQLTGYLLLLIILYVCIISFSRTKLEWYVVPVFPLLSFIIGMGIFDILTLISRKYEHTPSLRAFISVSYCALIFLYPYQDIGRKVYNPMEYKWDKEIYPLSYVLQAAAQGKVSLRNHVICYNDYDRHLLFYTTLLNERGDSIRFKPWDLLTENEHVWVSQPEIFSAIESTYAYEVVSLQSLFPQRDERLRLYKIMGRNTNEAVSVVE